MSAQWVQLHRVLYDETCQSIIAEHIDLDEVSLLNWNLNINPFCINFGSLAEILICVSPPGGDPGENTPITKPPLTPTENSATSVPRLTNGKDESNYPCAKWYIVQDGDFCESVTIRKALRCVIFTSSIHPSTNSAAICFWTLPTASRQLVISTRTQATLTRTRLCTRSRRRRIPPQRKPSQRWRRA